MLVARNIPNHSEQRIIREHLIYDERRTRGDDCDLFSPWVEFHGAIDVGGGVGRTYQVMGAQCGSIVEESFCWTHLCEILFFKRTILPQHSQTFYFLT